MQIDDRVDAEVNKQPFPFLFITISGAHLYGFASGDSDYDIRGAHILPLKHVLGLDTGPETIEVSKMNEGLEIDLVTHDVKKFFKLLMKKNGYVLEQLYSPLVVRTTPEHEELKHIAEKCITRLHSHHYFGFAETQWKLFEKEHPHRVKPLLYVFRVLLTGIHLMRTGKIEANLETLNGEFKLGFIGDLIERKRQNTEKALLAADDISLFRLEYERLRSMLEDASNASALPVEPDCRAQLNDLLTRIRLKSEPLPTDKDNRSS